MFSILDSWPNELAALFVLVIAFLAGFAAKKLVLLLLKSIGLDKAMEKANIAPSSRIKAFEFIGRLIYFAVFILFLPWIFWRLGVGNVSEPILGVTDFFKNHLPDIVAAFISAPLAGLIFLVVYVIYEQIENNLIAPKVQGNALDLPSVIILIAVTIGIYMFGLIGAIISIPIAGMVKVLIDEYPNIRALREKE